MNLDSKLLAITADNADNNGTLCSHLYELLSHNDITQYIEEPNLSIRFEGDASYVRCLAHVLNLIVKDILQSLKSGDMKTAVDTCDAMAKGTPFPSGLAALARLRLIIV